MTRDSGIGELMDDLGRAMEGPGELQMLGGGNPAAIAPVQQIWREQMARLLAEGGGFDEMLVNYDGSQGSPAFIDAVVSFFNETYGWSIRRANVAVTNSSQNAHFLLLNMLAGAFPGGRTKRVLLPLVPEYIGYADLGLVSGLFRAQKPAVEKRGDHEFKYHIDFDALDLSEDVGVVCVSRPTNPTGNVLTDDEVRRLAGLAKAGGVPLLVDNAYGAPFPNIIFEEVEPVWGEQVILTLSLSKLGLPGTRTGLVIAAEEVVSALSSVNAVTSLASGNIGQALVRPLMADGRLAEISRTLIRPFYKERAAEARAWVEEYFDPALPWRLHLTEGALFFWLWCEGLPITSKELYERLKARGVIVVPGSYFFYGLEEDWPHRHECLRINYSQPAATVRAGLRVIAEEVARAYHGA